MFSLFCYFVHKWINMTDINTSCSNYFSLFVANVLFLRKKRRCVFILLRCSYSFLPQSFFCATVICGTLWNTSRFLKSFRASEFCSGQPIFMYSLSSQKLKLHHWGPRPCLPCPVLAGLVLLIPTCQLSSKSQW